MSKEKNILGLQLPTDPRWADLAQISIEAILTDHAYCEQKAASNCISIITQFPNFPNIVEKLSPLVTEEWGHFRMVVRELKRRKLSLGLQRKDAYVNEIRKIIKSGIGRKELLVEKLLFSALIEARSCERFKLLSEKIADKDLKRFYHDLMVAEAAHYRLFIDLANAVMDEAIVHQRWKEFLAAEAEIMKTLEIRGDRIH
jgi:tRNA-(ms[2]io[6]A)-hydroxylase